MSELAQQKMLEIKDAFVQFTMQPEAFIWQLNATDGDIKMVQTFLTMHSRRKFESPDIVVWVTAPFDNDEMHYANLAIHALCETYDRLVASLWGDDDLWEPEFIIEEPETGSERLARLVQSMCQHHEGDFDTLLFVFSPAQISSYPKWCTFVEQFYRPFMANDTLKIRLGIIENLTSLAPIAKSLSLDDAQISRYDFASEMHDIMLDVLDNLDKQDETVEYQRQLTHTFKHQTENAPLKALDSAQAALNIATDNQFIAPKMIAFTLMYAIYVGLEDYDAAQAQAQSALDTTAELPSDTEGDQDVKASLIATAYSNLATAQMLNQYYVAAGNNYHLSSIQFESIDNWMLAYENYRMSARCFTRIDQFDIAWMQGESALVALYQTPESLWQDGTFSHLAQNMQLIKAQQNNDEQAIWEAHLVDILGEDWEKYLSKIEKIKMPAAKQELISPFTLNKV